MSSQPIPDIRNEFTKSSEAKIFSRKPINIYIHATKKWKNTEM